MICNKHWESSRACLSYYNDESICFELESLTLGLVHNKADHSRLQVILLGASRCLGIDAAIASDSRVPSRSLPTGGYLLRDVEAQSRSPELSDKLAQ